MCPLKNSEQIRLGPSSALPSACRGRSCRQQPPDGAFSVLGHLRERRAMFLQRKPSQASSCSNSARNALSSHGLFGIPDVASESCLGPLPAIITRTCAERQSTEVLF
jgi:hypothetical protein